MTVFAVLTQKGSNWLPDRGIREQPAWEEHARFFDQLVERGIVILGGPISSRSDDEVALLVVEVSDERELRRIFAEDPWATSEILRVKDVRAWTIWLDGR